MLISETINSKEAFCDFLIDLYNEYQQNGESWENNRLDTFLEALSRYANDIDGLYKNKNKSEMIGKASWQYFADILLGSTLYE